MQIDFIRTQFEKQYSSIKRRLDETETENERLIAQHRTESKELLLYKNLLEAPETSNSPTKGKDYQQLKLTIDAVLKENERLYAEIHEFKTSDPVYEQVQLLETANKHFKQELIQLTNQNNRLKSLINFDELKQLKTRLIKTAEECEKLKSLNKKLINQLEKRASHHPPTSPSQQVCLKCLSSSRSGFSHSDDYKDQISLDNNLVQMRFLETIILLLFEERKDRNLS